MGFRTFFAILLILVPSLRAGGGATGESQPARVRVAGSKLIQPLVEAWGRQLAERGIVVEALQAVTAHAMDTHGLHRLYATPYAWIEPGETLRPAEFDLTPAEP